MIPDLLSDTHVLLRWLTDQRLSRQQARALDTAMRRGESIGVSSMSLLEMAILQSRGRWELDISLEHALARLRDDPAFVILPLTCEVAAEVAHIANALRDPADSAIVATARVHRMRLLTSDERIIASRLVPTVD